MLTVLEEKLAEAHGLAMAATSVVLEVEDRVADPELLADVAAIVREAEATRARCLELERSYGDALATELLAHANLTHEHVADLTAAWFVAGTDPLSAWGFLVMAEAGELAAWSVVAELAARSGRTEVGELAAWALPLHEGHLATALSGAVRLAASFHPAAPRWG